VYVLVAAIVVLRATRVGMSRAAWIVIVVGVSLYAAGNVVWSLWLQHVPKPPIPSVCDALWLALYPASYVGIALLARRCWRGIPGLELHVAVNVTAADLLDDGFPSQVSEALARRGLPAGALVIEVTENAVLSDPAHTRDVLGRLRDLGVELSLDDFGTGVSSLVHLKRIPVGEIKIDRSFVTRMNFDPADAAIVHATIDLAHRLGKRVVAEGVEDEHTWKRLAAAGCHVIQGYALSRPPAGAGAGTAPRRARGPRSARAAHGRRLRRPARGSRRIAASSAGAALGRILRPPLDGAPILAPWTSSSPTAPGFGLPRSPLGAKTIPSAPSASTSTSAGGRPGPRS